MLFSNLVSVGVTLSGFSGIVLAFGSSGEPLGPTGRYRFAVLLVNALGAAFLGVTPLVLDALGVSDAALWRIASLGMAAAVGPFLTVWMRASMRTMRRSPEIFDLRTFALLAMMHAGNVVLQSTAAIGITDGPGVYAIGLLTLLAHATNQFIRMLFKPVTTGS